MIESKAFYEKVLDSVSDGIYCLDASRKIIFWSKSTEKLTGYTSQEVIGRSCADDILVHVDSNGARLCAEGVCPAHKTLLTNKEMEAGDVAFHHKDGHRVSASIRTTPLQDEAGKTVGVIEIFKELTPQGQLEIELKRLQDLALTDSLTRIGNRRYGQARLESCLSEMRRNNWPFGVLFFDVDHFKAFNDNWGHETGDQVLTMVAQTIAGNLRPFDIAVRWGGEEFMCLIVNVNETTLKNTAERLRVLVEQSFLSVQEHQISVTVSVGGSMCRKDDTPESLIKRADALMYKSKMSGRNRITIG